MQAEEETNQDYSSFESLIVRSHSAGGLAACVIPVSTAPLLFLHGHSASLQISG